jgi:hypothetical protein
MAIIVASPDLIRVSCRTPDQMTLVNALCRAWEEGSARTTALKAGRTPDRSCARRPRKPGRRDATVSGYRAQVSVLLSVR